MSTAQIPIVASRVSHAVSRFKNQATQNQATRNAASFTGLYANPAGTQSASNMNLPGMYLPTAAAAGSGGSDSSDGTPSIPTPVATTSTSSSSSSSSDPTGMADIQGDYTTFLQILTTELQNQDPTQPLDTNQFTTQLVMFSQLEQQLNTNSNLQTLIGSQATTALGTSLGYLGHTVEATGDSFSYDGSDDTTLMFSLPSQAANATVTILDSSGNTIQSLSVTPNIGINQVSYDGSTASGDTLPAGTYTFQVTATDASGNTVTPTTYTSGVVTGVDSANGTTTLMIGNMQVPASSVVQVTS